MNRQFYRTVLRQCVLSLLVIGLSLSPVQAYWLDVASDQAEHCHQMTVDNTQNIEKLDCCNDHAEQRDCQHCTHCAVSILSNIILLPDVFISSMPYLNALSTELLSRTEPLYRPPIL